MKMAKLTVNYGRTINLGNYESERIDISLEKEVYEQDWLVEADLLFSLLKTKLIELSAGKITDIDEFKFGKAG